MSEKKSLVVIGGGTGTHTLLRGLKHYANQLDITAVITMADSGGSTGRLRDEFGMLPVGDARMALAALASDEGEGEMLMRDLFLYRFRNGNGLKGHNLGNLLLTALSDRLGNEAAAIAAASHILRISGTVLPVTTDNTQLIATYDDGLTVEGEHNIDDPTPDRRGHRIIKLGLTPAATINPAVDQVIRQADIIVMGPGDLFSSLLANCVVGGVPEAIIASRARFIYVANLMERLGQTEGMMVKDCLVEIERYVGRLPDVVLINAAPLPLEVVRHYEEAEGTHPVTDDTNGYPGTIIRTDLISDEEQKQSAADQVRRSLIRHDPYKLATAILGLIHNDANKQTVD